MLGPRCLRRTAGWRRRGKSGVFNPTPTPTPGPGGRVYPATLAIADTPAFQPDWTVNSATVNPSNFDAVLAGLTGTEGVLYCAGGSYGAKVLSKRVAGGQVTLRAADINNPPIFENLADGNTSTLALRLRGVKNLCFDGWAIRAPNIIASKYFSNFCFLEPNGTDRPENIRLTRCVFSGGLDTAVSPNVGLGKAIKMIAALNVAIDQCRFPNTTYAIEIYGNPLARNENIYVGHNDFLGSENHSLDSIDIYGVHRCLIEWNQFFDRHYYPGGLHPDCIQAGDFTVLHGQDERATSVLIRDNFAAFTAATVWTDGTFLPVQTGWYADGESETSFGDWCVENNEFLGGSYHGITFAANSKRLLIRDNIVRPSTRANYIDPSNGQPLTPWISTFPGASTPTIDDITVTGNVTKMLTFGSKTTNITQSGNIVGAAGVSDAQMIERRDLWQAARHAARATG